MKIRKPRRCGKLDEVIKGIGNILHKEGKFDPKYVLRYQKEWRTSTIYDWDDFVVEVLDRQNEPLAKFYSGYMSFLDVSKFPSKGKRFVLGRLPYSNDTLYCLYVPQKGEPEITKSSKSVGTYVSKIHLYAKDSGENLVLARLGKEPVTVNINQREYPRRKIINLGNNHETFSL